jgi:hypothetical protein
MIKELVVGGLETAQRAGFYPLEHAERGAKCMFSLLSRDDSKLFRRELNETISPPLEFKGAFRHVRDVLLSVI